MKLRFLYAERGNAFLRELLEALAAAASDHVETLVIPAPTEEAEDDVIDVVIPHEYFGLDSGLLWPTRRRRRRMIAIITEHPSTPWFKVGCMAGAELGASFVLNRSAEVGARARGLDAGQLQLGYVPQWDTWGGAEVDRPIDITYLALSEHRRNKLIAGYCDVLWRWNTVFLSPPPWPFPSAKKDFMVGPEKWRHLASSKVLINLHRGGVLDTEWPRFMEAICNGAVVVSEHCADSSPLQPGEHYMSAAPERVATVADLLLRDPERLTAIRQRAYQFVRTEMPISVPGRQLVDAAALLVRQGKRPSLRHLLPPVSGATVVKPMLDSIPKPAAPNPSLAAIKAVAIDLQEVKRQQRRLEVKLFDGVDPDNVDTVYTSPSHAAANPRVTVVTPLYNHEVEVAGALRSLLASEDVDYEVVLVDDGSSDASVQVACSLLKERPEVPAVIRAAVVNHGPSWARNRCLEQARGDFVFFLDSDNAIYPPTLSRLASALDADPDAALAYPIVAVHQPLGPEMIISQFAWNPKLFSETNPIDTMAMVRRTVIEQLGGFSEDPRLQGLEDYDLWCRVADRGLYGVSVPQVLGWYRRTGHSVLSVADLDRAVALSLIRRRAPSVFSAAPL